MNNTASLDVLRRLERAEILIKNAKRRGVIRPVDEILADLQAILSHARRTIRVRKKAQLCTLDLENAAVAVEREIHAVEAAIQVN